MIGILLVLDIFLDNLEATRRYLSDVPDSDQAKKDLERCLMISEYCGGVVDMYRIAVSCNARLGFELPSDNPGYLIDVLYVYFKKHPERMDEDSYVVVRDALIEAYPPKRKAHRRR